MTVYVGVKMNIVWSGFIILYSLLLCYIIFPSDLKLQHFVTASQTLCSLQPWRSWGGEGLCTSSSRGSLSPEGQGHGGRASPSPSSEWSQRKKKQALQELACRCCESRSVETGGTERPAREMSTPCPGSWPPPGGSHQRLLTVPWTSHPHP